MIQCPTCGTQVEEGTDICPDCGTDLTTVATAPAEQAPPQEQQAATEPVQLKVEPAEAAPEAPVPVPMHVVTAQAPATITLKRAGSLTSEVFNLGDRVMIGRFDAETGPVDVDLGPLPESMYISRQHAEIFKNADGKWMIRDLGSSNGTFMMNSETGKFERVQGEQELQDGDEIALGNARFIFNTQ